MREVYHADFMVNLIFQAVDKEERYKPVIHKLISNGEIVLLVDKHLIVHGPEAVTEGRWTFLLIKAPHDFSIKYTLKFLEKLGEPYFRFRFWTPEPFKVKFSFDFTS